MATQSAHVRPRSEYDGSSRHGSGGGGCGEGAAGGGRGGIGVGGGDGGGDDGGDEGGGEGGILLHNGRTSGAYGPTRKLRPVVQHLESAYRTWKKLVFSNMPMIARAAWMSVRS